MNENKRIENPRIKILKCVGALKMKTRVESLKKNNNNNNEPIFNVKNFQFLNWFLPTEEIFQAHGLNRPVVNLLVFYFRSQPLHVGFFFSYFDFLRCSRPYWNVTITLKMRYVIISFKPSCSNSLTKSV